MTIEDADEPALRVLLVDDHDLFRTGLRNLLEEQGVEIVGEAGGGSEALAFVRELAPDVVVMDLNMPGMTGVEATRHISRDAPLTRVIVLTISDQPINGWANAITVGPADEARPRTRRSRSPATRTPPCSPCSRPSPPTARSPSPPEANANGSSELTIQLSDGSLAVTATRTITVTPVNDPPAFTALADLAVGEDGGARSFPGWATAISVGPADEAATQSPAFTVSGNSAPACSPQPAVSPTGTLTFTAEGERLRHGHDDGLAFRRG